MSSITKKSVVVPSWVDILENAVKTSKCKSQVLEKLGLSTDGSGNHRVVSRWISKLGLDISHFDYRKVLSDKLKKLNRQLEYNPDEFLIENWMGSISPVKRWAKNNLKYECKICHNKGSHNNLPLSLQLDHVNGNPKDNQKQNLRWLCPNCHTQCKTYGGKSLKLHRLKKSEINPDWNTKPRPHRRKVKRPNKETLEIEILEFPFEKLGKKYGVSGNMVKKWCKYYDIPRPSFGRGYWSKKK